MKTSGSGHVMPRSVVSLAVALMLGVSSYVHSQANSADPLEELLWLAAETLRDGDLKTAREILDLASVTEENPSPELLFLMDQLKLATKQQTHTPESDNQHPDALIQSATDAGKESPFADLKSLNAYLQSMTTTIEGLATPGRR